MPIFHLPKTPEFPDPEKAEPVGLLAVGGDLTPERLIAAYRKGIFPWYTAETPILWWSPDPRPIIVPHELHLSRSLRRTINSKRFTVTLDRDFAGVITHCAELRRDGEGTWLVPEMVDAFLRLHRMGLAHSAEAWDEDGELAGGVYGVSLGLAFFGESMFHLRPDASKVAFASLVRTLGEQGYHFIDCQQESTLVMRFGARLVSRREFLERLDEALRDERGPCWPAQGVDSGSPWRPSAAGDPSRPGACRAPG
jgi:leucyl/phenylalanyl-tRNA---protein transferase